MTLVITGDKLGLYKTLASEGPLSSEKLAQRSGTTERYVREWLPALMAWSFTRESPGRITQPVLNMTGANTASYFREIHENIKAWIPSAENDVVPDSTHGMMNTHPRPTAGCVAAFLARHPISQSG